MQESRKQIGLGPFVGFFVVLSLVFGLMAVAYLAHHQAQMVRSLQDELTAIATLKVREIVTWREDRLEDARAVMRDPFLPESVQRFLQNPADSDLRARLLTRLGLIRGQNQFGRAMLLDNELKVRLTLPDGPAGLGCLAQLQAADASQAHDVRFSDLHGRGGRTRIHFDLAIPLWLQGNPSVADTPAAPGPAPPTLALINLEIEPRKFLYPLLQNWPTRSQTAETLLVRREGDTLVYLSALRHRTNAPLSYRVDLARTNLVEVGAVLGTEAAVEGFGYHGLPVVAASRSVPGTTWFLVAQIDRAEALAPMRGQTCWALAGLAFSLVLTGLLLWVFWHRRETQFLRQELLLQRERQLLADRLGQIGRQINDMVLLLDEHQNIIEVNDRAAAAYGYSIDEFRHLKMAHLRPPELRAELQQRLAAMDSTKGILCETRHQRKDGSTFPVESSVRRFEQEGRRFYQVVLRDITDRKRVEDQLRKLSRAVEQSSASIVITDLEGRIEYVNPQFSRVTGYSSAEALGQNPRVLKSGEMPAACYQQLWETIKSGREWQGEFHNRRKNGELFWELASISPVVDDTGRVTHFVAIKEDITARKLAEHEREQLVKRLEEALASVKTLRGLVPICAGCKRVREDGGFWSQVETYVAAHSEARFSHGLCPQCLQKFYPELEPDHPSPSPPTLP
jgi:two-component system, sensor histidine kinase and response regulator